MRQIKNRPGYHTIKLHGNPLSVGSLETGNKVPGNSVIKKEPKTLIYSQEMEKFGPVIVKTYCHRGPVNWKREKMSRFRVQREFDALAYLASHDVCCSIPLFWFHGQSKDYGRYETLVTREIPSATAMDVSMKKDGFGSKVSDFLPLCKLVRKMHSVGFYHGSLMTLRNVLVTPTENGEVGMHLIDTPRSMSFPYDLFGTKMARADLLDMCWCIAQRFGAEQCKSLLIHYGLDNKLIPKFIEQLKHHKTDKYSRKYLHNAFTLRRILAPVGVRSLQPDNTHPL